jgi:hypothetical protein
MGSMLTGRAQRYVADAARAWERAPVEVSVALLLAVAFSRAVELGGEVMRSFLEVAITGALIIAAAWTGTLLHALGGIDRRWRWIITVAVAAAAALYGWLLLDLERAAEAWRAVMLLAAAVLWLVALPYLPRRSIDEMRGVTGRFLLRVIGALLYCGALFAGLALAVGAVNTLFELDLAGTIYAHVFGWIFLALAPWIVFGGLDEYTTTAESGVAPVVHRMAAFLVPPLVAVYYAILYAYALRMAVTGEVPKNLVSPLVFAAGILVGLALLLFDPRQRTTASAALLRAAPPLFVPLAALGAWTVLVRVEQYGWTEFRLLRLLLLVAFGLIAAGASLQFLRGRRFSLHVLPLGAAALLLLSAIGPWSVGAVSRRSQQVRLETYLAQAGVAATEPAPADAEERTIDARLFEQITSTGQYLASHHGAGALPLALVAAPVRAGAPAQDRGDVYAAVHALGLRPGLPDVTDNEMRYGRLSHAGGLQVDGWNVRRVYVAPYRGEMASGDATGSQDGDTLRVRVDGRTLSADLSELARSLRSPRDPRSGELPPDVARLELRNANGSVAGSLLVLEVNLELTSAGIRLHRLDALLIYRSGGVEAGGAPDR